MAKQGIINQLVVQAEELAMEASANTCPVLLRQVAARRRITEIVFGPLLVDALITTHPSGFRVFFRSDRDEALSCLEAYKNESAKNLLPSRIRFSLAHEIAHTFFYDLSKAPPKIKESASEAELDELEVMCNRLAGHLLMPSKLLKSELPNLKPESILSGAGRFGVSPETLVAQFTQQPGLLTKHNIRGCIIVLMDTLRGFEVKAIARQRHIVVPAELRNIQRGELLQGDGIKWNEIFAGKENGQTDLPLTLKTNLGSEQKNYNFEFVRYSNSPEGDLYLTTVDLAGQSY